MKRSHWSMVLVETAIIALIAAGPAVAANEVGKAVALRGKAYIERAGRRTEAKLKSPIEVNDIVTTAEASKVKLLFIDDSVLTLAEKSRFSVKEFVHSKETKGKSIFNLIDGKMRAVVGKTKFEVQTPTAVAAARGTVIFFEVGMIGTNPFTRIICLEGTVGVTSVQPPGAPLPASLDLKPGMMVTVVAGETAPPAPVQTPPAVIERLKQETATKTTETTLSQTGAYQVGDGSTLSATTTTVTVTGSTSTTATSQPPTVASELTTTPPPINYTPPKQPIGVNLNIRIPVYTPPAP
ncbi:MAG TPA: FecR family protein [Geobacteraceae bacterium]